MKTKLVPGLRMQMSGNRGRIYTLLSKDPRSSKWVCTYPIVYNGTPALQEVRISVLELHRDFVTV